jgi:hypothetical protein
VGPARQREDGEGARKSGRANGPGKKLVGRARAGERKERERRGPLLTRLGKRKERRKRRGKRGPGCRGKKREEGGGHLGWAQWRREGGGKETNKSKTLEFKTEI